MTSPGGVRDLTNRIRGFVIERTLLRELAVDACEIVRQRAGVQANWRGIVRLETGSYWLGDPTSLVPPQRVTKAKPRQQRPGWRTAAG